MTTLRTDSKNLVPTEHVPSAVRDLVSCIRSVREPGAFHLTPELRKALDEHRRGSLVTEQKCVLVLLDFRTFVYPLISQYERSVKRLKDRDPQAEMPLATYSSFLALWEAQFTKVPEQIRDWSCKLLGTENPLFKFVVVDDRPKYWRSELYPEYKVGRKPKPENWDLVTRAGYHAASQLGYPLVYEQGMEADDLIAQFVRNREDYRHKGVEGVVIWTVDTDLLQLVTEPGESVPTVWFNSPYAPFFRDFDETLKYWEKRWKHKISRPRQIVDFKSEFGDSSDNLPPGSDPKLIDLWDPGMYPLNRYDEALNYIAKSLSYLQEHHRATALELLLHKLTPLN